MSTVTAINISGIVKKTFVFDQEANKTLTLKLKKKKDKSFYE